MLILQKMLVVLLLTVNAQAAEPPTIYQLVDQYGPIFGVATSTLNQVIECESGHNQEARGKAGEIGIAQFMPTTFSGFAKEYGAELDIYNTEHQVLLMSWAFSKGKQSHWTCWKLLGQPPTSPI